MRQFLALELTDRTRREIGGIATRLAGLGGWRWIRPDSLHLTLRFLGEVDEKLDERSRPGWERAARGVGSFRFRLAGLGCFPPRGRPRVLWLGVREESARLAALALALEKAATSAGFETDRRAFHPHLTLARARKGARAERPAVDGVPDEWTEEASRIVLFRSLLAPAGARYTALASFPLGAAPGTA